jgi:hypothetical protein
MTHDPAIQRHELAYQFIGEVLKRKHGQDIRYTSAEITGSYPMVPLPDPAG